MYGKEKSESRAERLSDIKSDRQYEKKSEIIGENVSNNVEKECKGAIKSALNILAYAPNPEKKLREKLKTKGFSQNAADCAVAYVKEKGYLNEAAQAERMAELLAKKKFYGKARIYAELYKKGYSREAVGSVDLSEYDFAALCAEYILKTEDADAVTEKNRRDKLAVALRRRGYSGGEILTAMRKCLE